MIKIGGGGGRTKFLKGDHLFQLNKDGPKFSKGDRFLNNGPPGPFFLKYLVRGTLFGGTNFYVTVLCILILIVIVRLISIRHQFVNYQNCIKLYKTSDEGPPFFGLAI